MHKKPLPGASWPQQTGLAAMRFVAQGRATNGHLRENASRIAKKMHFRQFRQRIFFAFAPITGNLAFVVQVCALPLPSI
jgi:hypothetical protein